MMYCPICNSILKNSGYDRPFANDTKNMKEFTCPPAANLLHGLVHYYDLRLRPIKNTNAYAKLYEDFTYHHNKKKYNIRSYYKLVSEAIHKEEIEFYQLPCPIPSKYISIHPDKFSFDPLNPQPLFDKINTWFLLS